MYQGLMDYLKKCPHLAEGKFNFDFIGDEVGYSLTIPENTPEISKDIYGNTKNRLVFHIQAVKPFGKNNDSNMSNLEIFQKLKDWLSEQNANGIYPDFGTDKIVIGVYAATDGYILGTQKESALYEIQARVEYTIRSKGRIKAPSFF